MTTSSHPELLGVLTREGVLLNVSVRYWRGCKKLKAEDLGLDPDDVSARLISLGHKRLLPREAMATLALVESRAHALVEANTFPFLNGLAHFLPNPRLDEVTGRLEELGREFWAAKQTFLDRYATLRTDAATEWQAMAAKLVADPARLVATIEDSFPQGARMDRFFGYDLNLFHIAVPERLGLDLVSVADQQQIMLSRQQAGASAAAKIHREVESFVTDCVATMREQTAKLCEEMLESMRTGETGVHQKTLNRLTRFIDQFKQMNFAQDIEMEQQLDTVRRELLSRTAQEYRDSATARQRLTTGLGHLAEQARQLVAADKSAVLQRLVEPGRRRFHLAA